MSSSLARLGRIALLISLLAPVQYGFASTVDFLDVERHGKRYVMTMDARLNCVAEEAYAVFVDYRQLPRIHPAIISAVRKPGAPPGAQRLHSKVELCFLGFCRVLDQVQDMYREPPEHLKAIVLPELSNLRHGTASWRIWDDAGETRLRFEAEIEPDFWVPPLIGPWIIRRTLSQHAVYTADSIERLANR